MTVRVLYEGDKGSDSDTKVRATSAGDVTHDAADAWVGSDESFSGDPSDPTVGSVFDSTPAAADRLDATSDFLADEDDDFVSRYEDVVVPSGSSYTYMHLTAQRVTSATQQATDDTTRLARGPASVYDGMTDGERSQLRNFPADGDGDADGVRNRADNCADTANADQANLDGDAQGDVCDADQDGDGLSNAAEAEFGTNARAADSDGDGKNDRADGCPTRAGTNADGCPVKIRTQSQSQSQSQTETVRVPSFDRFAPKSMSARVRRSGRRYTTSASSSRRMGSVPLRRAASAACPFRSRPERTRSRRAAST